MENIFILRNEEIRQILLIPTGQGVGIKDGVINEDYIIEMAIPSILHVKTIEDVKADGWVLDPKPWSMGIILGKAKTGKDNGNHLTQKL